MSGDQPPVDPTTLEQTKQQIRGLVHEIAQLAKSDASAEKFYAEYLTRIVNALAAVGGAIWIIDEQRRMRLAYQIKLSQTLLEQGSDDSLRHQRLLLQVLQGGEPALVPPMSGTADGEAGGNPTNYLLIVALLRGDSQVEGIIEIFQRPDSSPSTQKGYLRFVLQMVELAVEWFKSRKLRDFTDRQSLWGQADQFSRLVHESLDVPLTAYTLVNEARRLIGCDRVSLAIKRGRKCHIAAISGQDVIDPRSNVTTTLRELANRVVATGDPLWYSGTSEDLPPQVEQALEAYIETAHSKTVAVIPLHAPEERRHSAEAERAEQEGASARGKTEVIGALIIEQIESNVARDTLAARTSVVCEHGSRALSNSLAHSRVPLMPLWRLLGKGRWMFGGRTLPKTVLVVLLLASAITALVVVPADFRPRGKGKLQPVVKQDVFVDVEGVVENILVRHGAKVQQGEKLVQLRSTKLELELEDVRGRRDATLKQIDGIDSVIAYTKKLEKEEHARLNGQKAELRVRVEGLDRQLALLEEQKSRLVIVSPITGEIVTWNVDETLRERPVTVGQVLMTVADPKREWELEVFMPDARIGHVRAAEKELPPGQALAVHYVTATDPGRQLQGEVVDIAPLAEYSEEEGHAVRIKVNINKNDLNDPRPGSTVTAEVYCGRRSLGYVWFHEVWEWVQRNVLF